MRLPQQKTESGFTIVELLVVCMIILVIAVLALPTMTSVFSAAQTRMSMGEISGVYQNSRSDAVRLNKMKTVHYTTVNGRNVAFTQDASATPDITAADHIVYLPPTMAAVTSPSGGVTVLDAATMWGNDANVLTTDPSFNPRGLPCSYSSSTGKCSTGSGFVYYFSNTNALGGTRWSAVSVSAAGRIKVWSWNGTAWGD